MRYKKFHYNYDKFFAAFRTISKYIPFYTNKNIISVKYLLPVYDAR